MSTEPLSTCPHCGAATKAGARFCRSCGVQFGGAAPAADLVPLPAVDRVRDLRGRVRVIRAAVTATLRRWSRSRRARLLAGGGLALVVLGSVGLVVVLRQTNPPDEPVRNLFSALAEKDAKRAGDLAGCRPTAMCAAGALRSGYEPPTQVKILKVTYGESTEATRRPDKSHAVVRVSYLLARVAHTDTVAVLRSGSGLVREWRISDPPGGWLDVVSTTVAAARLGGATVPTVTVASASQRDTGSVYAWPGVYTLAAQETALVAAVPATVVVAGDSGSQRLTLNVTVRPEIASEVERQIREHIDTCASKTDLRPDTGGGILANCPFDANPPYTYTKDVRWTVVDYPTIEIRKKDDGSVTARTMAAGHVRVDMLVSTDIMEPRRWTTYSETSEVKVSGAVTVDKGNIVWNG